MINFKNLRTDNYVLRKLNNSDKDNLELFLILNSPDVLRYIPGLYMSTIEELDDNCFIYRLNNTLLLVIEDINSSKLVGLIFIYFYSHNNTATISYAVSEDRRGENIMPRVLSFFLKHLYDSKTLEKLYFYINSTNNSSISVMRKLNIPYSLDMYDNLVFNLSLIEELPF